jgi:hypothetical protein
MVMGRSDVGMKTGVKMEHLPPSFSMTIHTVDQMVQRIEDRGISTTNVWCDSDWD